MCGEQCFEVPEIVTFLQALVQSIKDLPKDDEGLSIMENDHGAVKVFSFLMDMMGDKWHTVPVLVSYVEATLRSRQARRVMWQWIKHQVNPTAGLKTPGQAVVLRKQDPVYKQRWHEAILKLLAITKSAIHLRFVWRHLLRYDQQSLTPFLNAKSTFRGVYYLDPVDRGALVAKGGVTPNARNVWWDNLTPENMAKAIQKEKDLEAEIAASGAVDVAEYWRLTACYGLRRLLPRQSRLLAVQHAHAALNKDRGVPDRVKSLALWSLLPTTSYAECVNFSECAARYQPQVAYDGGVQPYLQALMDKKEQKAAAASQSMEQKASIEESKQEEKKKEKKEDKWPLNLSETLIRGVMSNDDKLAPLRYLLQPRFLSSQFARVAVYAVGACLPHTRPEAFSQIMRFLLTGKRRNVLKVTAYKEAMRLIASHRCATNTAMLLHEWQRAELHRDVRITIIQIAIQYLKYEDESGADGFCWTVLNDAVRRPHPEILQSLLGAVPQSLASQISRLRRNNAAMLKANPSAQPADVSSVCYFQPKGLTLSPTAADVVNAMRKCTVPAAHCSRYVNDIMLKLTLEDVGDDIRTLASLAILDWVEFCNDDCIDTVAQVWQGMVSVVDSKLLMDPRPRTQKVFNARWTAAMQALLYVSYQHQVRAKRPLEVSEAARVSTQARFAKAIRQLVDQTMSASLAELPRSARVTLFSRVDQLVAQVFDNNNDGCVPHDSPLIEPFKLMNGEVFWSFLFTKLRDHLHTENDMFDEWFDKGLAHTLASPSDAPVFVDEVVHSMTSFHHSDYRIRFVADKLKAIVAPDVAPCELPAVVSALSPVERMKAELLVACVLRRMPLARTQTALDGCMCALEVAFALHSIGSTFPLQSNNIQTRPRRTARGRGGRGGRIKYVIQMATACVLLWLMII